MSDQTNTSKAETYFIIESCIVDETITIGAPGFRRPVISEPEIFLAKIHNEIAERIDTKNRTPYDLIRVAALLRQLFIDDTPLLHLVNRKYRLDLKASLPPSSPIEIRKKGLTMRGFVGDLQECKPTAVSAFLSRECIMLDGDSFTVSEIIILCANKRGGVHFDMKLSPKQAKLIQYHLPENGLIFGRGGFDNPALFLIMQIAIVSLSITKPLVLGIKSDVRVKIKASFGRRLFDRISDLLIYGSSRPRR